MTERATPNSIGSPHISDELLSAYMDGAVNDDERRLVEAALYSDAETAWRLDALRQTVIMLRALPQVKLPRVYALPALLAAEQAAAAGVPGGAIAEPVAGSPHRPATTTARKPAPAPRSSIWDALGAFFGSGNMALRNSAAAAFALFVVLLASSQAITGSRAGTESQSAAPAAQMVTMAADAASADSAAAPMAASAEAAPVEQPAAAQADASAPVVAASTLREAAQEESVADTSAPDAAAEAPVAMMAAAPESTSPAADAGESSAMLSAAAPPQAVPPQGMAPPGMGGEGMGGEGMGGPAAAPMLTNPDAAGGAEALTGLDEAMAEAGVAATSAEPRTAAGAGPPQAELTASTDAIVRETDAPAGASTEASPATTASTALAAKAAEGDGAAAVSASTESSAEAAVLPAAADTAVEPSFSNQSWGVAWLPLAAWALGGLALLLTLLWLISRGRARSHA